VTVIGMIDLPLSGVRFASAPPVLSPMSGGNHKNRERGRRREWARSGIGRSGTLVDQFVVWYAEAGDKARALAALKKIDPKDLSVTFIGDALIEIGQKQRAVEMARGEIDAALKEAREMALPNYHHPAAAIRRALEFLVDSDETKSARQQLARVRDAVKAWPVTGSAWVAAAVYTQLARAVAKLEGRAAAERLLAQAADAARGEKAASIRGGAWSSLIDLYRQLGVYDDALALVKNLNEPEQRRLTAARILAQAGRWDANA
jgi:hypothetical protein